MSGEILQALTQLFAIVTRQDGIISEEERDYVSNLFQYELDPGAAGKYVKLFDGMVGYEPGQISPPKSLSVAASVRDTIQVLAICKKINKSLDQAQKINIMIKILELVAIGEELSKKRLRIIEAISAIFNISDQDQVTILQFVSYNIADPLDTDSILLANRQEQLQKIQKCKHYNIDISGEVVALNLSSLNIYYIRYLGEEEIILNGFIMKPGTVYLFPKGSTLKSLAGHVLYYSDLVSNYLEEISWHKISFNAKIDEYQFPNGDIGLRDILISEGPGKLVGIMGGSGAGKTTLLNALAGINQPSKGLVKVNGIDINSVEGKKKLKGILGYIAQDDLLIEDLTVYQNLYYNAKLCFADSSDQVIDNKITEVLQNLGMEERRNMKVGNVLDQTLSGGQRKRLNIALELIREPSILFVDEPTSGLSSRDSENVMDLLKELTFRGKLIFVVIHQPSSDIYKLFDRMILMDTGGFPIYYGNPVDAVTYFKRATLQVDAERGICPTCGNVNPEQIFNIVEAKAVDEYGNFTNRRKVTPKQWEDLFFKSAKIKKVPDETKIPLSSLKIPNQLKQSIIFLKRDFLSKLSDQQYMLINLLEAPVLALILTFIVRYKNSYENTVYLFRFNDNIPIFLMMSIIVALFLGLMVSAEEIIRDRKILKREAFLQLSRNSYLLSKVILLFILSAIQAFTFVIISVLILKIQGMILPLWFVLFTTSCFGNLLGLNISSAFRNSITVYILIPLLVIPQMILSGLLVPFDKINELFGNKYRVPLVADIMTTRWAYEAMAVYQFQYNRYERPLFDVELEANSADFNGTFYVEKVKELMDEVTFLRESREDLNNEDTSLEAWKVDKIKNNLKILRREIRRHYFFDDFQIGYDDFYPDKLTPEIEEQFYIYLKDTKKKFIGIANTAISRMEKIIHLLEDDPRFGYDLNEMKNNYYNERMADLVRNVDALEKIIAYKGRLVLLGDPIYNKELNPSNLFDYRAHFFAPNKHFFGFKFDTFNFNNTVIWIFSILLYITLYLDLFKRIIKVFDKRRAL